MSGNKKLKVMLLIESMRNGGAQKIILNYLRDFKNDNQIDLKLYTFSSPSNSNCDMLIEQENLNVKYAAPQKIINIPYVKRVIYKIKVKNEVRKALREFKPDIVHVHISAFLEECMKAIVKNSVPVRFSTLHSNPLRYNGKILSIIKRAFVKENFIPICLTQEQADIATKHYGLKNYEIVHNGIDYEDIKNKIMSKSDARKLYNIADDAFVVIGVGRLDKIKNYDLLIDSFNKLQKEKNNAILLIAGEGPERTHLEEKIKLLNLEEKVKLLGNLTNVIPLYCAADILGMTSISEASPLVLLEAQICNLNCVISNGVPNESIINDRVKSMNRNATIDDWANSLQDINYRGKAVSEFNSFEVHTASKKIKEIYLKYWKEYLDEKK